MKRHEVSEEEWAILDPLIPKSGARTGRPPRDRREMLNGVLWVLSTGAAWRDLPERFGPWQSVYEYFSTWRGNGVFDAIIDALHVRLDQSGQIDWDLWCIDGSSARATRAAAGASKKAWRATPMSQPTMLWASREADSAANSTSSSTATARRCTSK
jgi:transposase